MKDWKIYLFVYMPVMKTTYAAAFIIVFMTSWNAFLWPLIVLQSAELKTINLVLSSLSSAYFPDFGIIMVGTVVATIPTLAVFRHGKEVDRIAGALPANQLQQWIQQALMKMPS